MFRFALADVVILNPGGHSIFWQTFTLRSERFRSEFEGCFDIWNPTNFQGREKTNNIVGRHRGYLVMLGVKIHCYNIDFFVEVNRTIVQEGGENWERSFVTKKQQKYVFSRWQISGFVQNVKQKFIQSVRGVFVLRHKANESGRGKSGISPAPQGRKLYTTSSD